MFFLIYIYVDVVSITLHLAYITIEIQTVLQYMLCIAMRIHITFQKAEEPDFSSSHLPYVPSLATCLSVS